MDDKQIVRLKLCNIIRYTDNEEDEVFAWDIFNNKQQNIGEFEFKRDASGRLWLNNCDISIQGKGIGSAVIKYAVSILAQFTFARHQKKN